MHAAIAALTWLALTGPDPTADEKVGKVRCDIQVIHATHGDPSIDPALKPISGYLTKSFGNTFQSFKLIGSGSLLLGKDQRGAQKLPNDTEMALTFLGVEESFLRLAMELSGLKTNVKVHDGGLFFQAGRSYKGGMLIVAIRTRQIQ